MSAHTGPANTGPAHIGTGTTGKEHSGPSRRQAAEVPRPDQESVALNPVFARPGETTELPRFRLPRQESLPETAYQIVHDEAMLDGNARLNLATFVGTWMDDDANRLYLEAADKNMIDKDEYPRTAEIETRCARMLADLWHAPDPQRCPGTSTIGSSEACMLAGLALKRRWTHARRAAGRSSDRPNLVMSSAVQVCWEKFCNYWDVEMRQVPVSADLKVLDGHRLDEYIDDHTIGVVAIMGVTYTGMYEPVAEISAALDAIQESTGLDVRIHVDGASGAMIAPLPPAGSGVGLPGGPGGVDQHLRPQVRAGLPGPGMGGLARQPVPAR
ncbi:Glutamate decarboxylase [Acidipropionibacterium jensenii]|uniref:glutamate decarboxylase n=1 Tax=Acidipropionibacterium jensenii TaxID=1749 RepID=A0A448NWR8_9ACTN|nr:pyridoxal-dependent decarboxylase [Acidipropionibacterium jensenii]VEI02319.1 Glutamate decarboxylase [Acidipropionibacterium jensenii]